MFGESTNPRSKRYLHMVRWFLMNQCPSVVLLVVWTSLVPTGGIGEAGLAFAFCCPELLVSISAVALELARSCDARELLSCSDIGECGGYSHGVLSRLGAGARVPTGLGDSAMHCLQALMSCEKLASDLSAVVPSALSDMSGVNDRAWPPG